MSSISSSQDPGSKPPIFTSEENEPLREAGDFPEATRRVPMWGQGWSDARASVPSATLPSGHDRSQNRSDTQKQLYLWGQCRVLSPQKLPFERGQVHF